MEAFVYSWTNTSNGKLYIGYHKGNPDDGYVCSSKPMLEDFMLDRTVFVRQIVATGSHKDMKAFESTLLVAFDAKSDPQFYNRSNGMGKDIGVEKHTEKTKEKMSKAHTGMKKPWVAEMNKERGATKGSWKVGQKSWKGEHPMLGKNHSNESLEKMSLNRKGKGTQPKSKETKDKMKQASLKIQPVTCPHCNVSGKPAPMNRWHFDNCRGK